MKRLNIPLQMLKEEGQFFLSLLRWVFFIIVCNERVSKICPKRFPESKQLFAS